MRLWNINWKLIRVVLLNYSIKYTCIGNKISSRVNECLKSIRGSIEDPACVLDEPASF